jgi:hypothetical protein
MTARFHYMTFRFRYMTARLQKKLLLLSARWHLNKTLKNIPKTHITLINTRKPSKNHLKLEKQEKNEKSKCGASSYIEVFWNIIFWQLKNNNWKKICTWNSAIIYFLHSYFYVFSSSAGSVQDFSGNTLLEKLPSAIYSKDL